MDKLRITAVQQCCGAKKVLVSKTAVRSHLASRGVGAAWVAVQTQAAAAVRGAAAAARTAVACHKAAAQCLEEASPACLRLRRADWQHG